ncbi:hypothetical protein RB213_002006 [Colletotrichum asianum]
MASTPSLPSSSRVPQQTTLPTPLPRLESHSHLLAKDGPSAGSNGLALIYHEADMICERA